MNLNFLLLLEKNSFNLNWPRAPKKTLSVDSYKTVNNDCVHPTYYSMISTFARVLRFCKGVNGVALKKRKTWDMVCPQTQNIILKNLKWALKKYIFSLIATLRLFSSLSTFLAPRLMVQKSLSHSKLSLPSGFKKLRRILQANILPCNIVKRSNLFNN